MSRRRPTIPSGPINLESLMILIKSDNAGQPDKYEETAVLSDSPEEHDHSEKSDNLKYLKLPRPLRFHTLAFV